MNCLFLFVLPIYLQEKGFYLGNDYLYMKSSRDPNSEGKILSVLVC